MNISGSNKAQHEQVGVNVYFYTFIERKYITLESGGDQSSPDESNTAKDMTNLPSHPSFYK